MVKKSNSSLAVAACHFFFSFPCRWIFGDAARQTCAKLTTLQWFVCFCYSLFRVLTMTIASHLVRSLEICKPYAPSPISSFLFSLFLKHKHKRRQRRRKTKSLICTNRITSAMIHISFYIRSSHIFCGFHSRRHRFLNFFWFRDHTRRANARPKSNKRSTHDWTRCKHIHAHRSTGKWVRKHRKRSSASLVGYDNGVDWKRQ